MQLYRRGDHGAAVAEIRGKLAVLGLLADPAGDLFDDRCDRAVREFQQGRGLRVDGIVGPETYRALDEARWRLGDRLLSLSVAHPFVGDDVVELQQRLLEMGFDPGRGDGIFGPRTEAALRDFQRGVGLAPDGTCGPRTLKALHRLSRMPAVGGRPDAMREEARLERGGATLAGKVVVVDPGHGGGEPGATGHGLREADLVLDLARRLEGRLGALGAAGYLTRGPDGCPTDAERAGFANDTAADLFLSLHLDSAPSPSCTGVAAYYFAAARGGRQVGSAVGERLAELVLREVASRTDLADCRSHPKSWDLLRLTRMPAVRCDLGYLSNPRDAARLADPAFRDALAEGVAAAVRRLYLPEGSPAGALLLPALTR